MLMRKGRLAFWLRSSVSIRTSWHRGYTVLLIRPCRPPPCEAWRLLPVLRICAVIRWPMHIGWPCLARAIARLPIQRNSPEPDWMWDTAFDPIRNDPRFKAVLEKMGLPYTPAIAPTP